MTRVFELAEHENSQKSDFQLTFHTNLPDDSAELPCPTPLPARQQEQLDQLIRQYRPLLRKLCTGFFKGLEDSEDLEAMVVLAACRRFRSYDPARGAFGTWLGAIVRNEASDMRRRLLRQPVCVPNTPITERIVECAVARADDPVDEFEGFELAPLLRRAFELVKVKGLTCAEAGRLMGKTEGTVRTYVWKARQVMKGAAFLG